MNLQSMTIIFVIIFLPIILISTYYIQREVDTITLQTSYDTKLIDATTDAVSAFEINTANEDLSSVSDSLRSIIEASNNVFTTTMATNLGMSGATKSKVLPYIPAVVYTLYDGYYIYSPTKQPKVVTDPDGVYVRVGDPGVNYAGGIYTYKYEDVENGSTDTGFNIPSQDYGKILYYSTSWDGTNSNSIECVTNPDSAYRTTSYILKSFIPYSMQYQWTNSLGEQIDVTINYTLDNYITVYGTIAGVYYSKSGYLIDYNRIEITGIPSSIENYSINEIDDLVNNNDDITIKVDEVEITSSSEKSATSEHYSGAKMSDNKSAIAYYLKAYIFSKWVDEKLSGINPSGEDVISDNLKTLQDGFSIKQSGEILENFDEGQATLFWDYNEESIFKTDGNWNVENSQSNFYEHKRKVIKNSIQYSLNQAMATYNQGQGDEYYQMPLLSEPEWDKLLSNVSVLAFMQGLPCGLKTYNNYAIVTSTNNEIMANVDDIYYVPVGEYIDIEKKGFSTQAYSYINLGIAGTLTTKQKDIIQANNYDFNSIKLPTAHHIDCNKINNEIINVLYYQSFPSRELKYDKEYNSNLRGYEYDHVCNTCYECIVNSNYTMPSDFELTTELKRAELIAIAKIRNNTYKSCAIKTNNGINVVSESKSISCDENYKLEDAKDCYEIQVTIKSIEDAGKYDRNTISLGDEEMTYSCEVGTNTQTIIFNKPNSWGENPLLKIGKVYKDVDGVTKIARIEIVSITYKYK